MKKYLNESLPKEQRLGQVGVSNKYGEMKIVEYKNHKDIDVYFKEYDQTVKHKAYSNFLVGKIGVKFHNERLGEIEVNDKGEEMIISEYNNANNIVVTFLHNWIDVKTNYYDFKRKLVKNPLYYKEQRQGKMEKSNNGQMMLLLIYNDCENCVVEFEDGTLVDCEHGKFNSGEVANPNYIKPSKNKFYYNNELGCWVGITNKGDKFLFSHPDKKVIEEIKQYTWRKTNYDYFKNKYDKRLHHIILPLTNEARKQGYDRIDHINNNPLDNRYENLRWSNAKENAKNRKSSGKSGITGLIKSKSGKWHGSVKINEVAISTSNKSNKQDAIIDLLILQRYFNITHNERLFYLLDDISQDYITNIENMIKRKYANKLNSSINISNNNTFNINIDYCEINDNNNFKKCIIDIEDVKKIKLGNWNYYKNSKEYFIGMVNINNEITRCKIHRYILQLINIEYKDFSVDHLDGNSLNNTKNNLIITDRTYGNNINILGKGFSMDKRNGNLKSVMNLGDLRQSRSFDTKQEAITFYNHYKQILLDGRLQWKTKEELDNWLENIKDNELDVDDVIKQHYAKLYKHVYNLIEVEYPRKK